jgi:hypothetical protein
MCSLFQNHDGPDDQLGEGEQVSHNAQGSHAVHVGQDTQSSQVNQHAAGLTSVPAISSVYVPAATADSLPTARPPNSTADSYSEAQCTSSAKVLTTIPEKVLSAMSDEAVGTSSDQTSVVTCGVVPANTPQQEKHATVTGVPVRISACVPAATPNGVTDLTTPGLQAANPQEAQARDPNEAPGITPSLIQPTQTKTERNRKKKMRYRMNKRMQREAQVWRDFKSLRFSIIGCFYT